MVAETATAPLIPVPCSDEEQHVESTTTCAYCANAVNVYQMGDDKWICVEHIVSVVSLAANDIFSDCVSYTREFERVIYA